MRNLWERSFVIKVSEALKKKFHSGEIIRKRVSGEDFLIRMRIILSTSLFPLITPVRTLVFRSVSISGQQMKDNFFFVCLMEGIIRQPNNEICSFHNAKSMAQNEHIPYNTQTKYITLNEK